jgi:uncharacterized protein YgbK (DUF1537 family)
MMADIMTSPAPLVALEDDPTGAQTLVQAHVMLTWAEDDLRAAPDVTSLHLLTNSRALEPATAEQVVSEAARSARQAWPERRIVLRGDSTLRGHLLEEYRGYCAGLGWPASAPLLLVPALPSAGRITVGGVHFLVRNGHRTPIGQTEYATDSTFGYRASRVVQWAAERSGGLFAPADGVEIGIAALSSQGPEVVASALLRLARLGRPAVCVPDAESVDDLQLIAEGLLMADRAGAPIAVRCAPAFVGVLAGNTASELVAMPGGRTLLVCGSWVPSSSEQLRHLTRTHGLTVIEASATDLADRSAAAVTALARLVDEALVSRGVAVLATERTRPAELRDLAAGERIASSLADVVGALKVRPDVIVAKGGVTSAVVLKRGLGARSAGVVGPVQPGVSLWSADGADGPVPYVVVPGNVGGPSLLSDLLDSAGGPGDRRGQARLLLGKGDSCRLSGELTTSPSRYATRPRRWRPSATSSAWRSCTRRISARRR